MLREYIYLTDDEIQLTPICEDCGPNAVPIMRKEELIRCKDCKHYDGYYCHEKWWGNGYGNYTPPIKDEDGFCDWAERKEEWK